MELATALKDYVGRETPLYHAQNLTNHYKNINGEGPEIYLKREDLNHGGSYKMNNVIAQAILAKLMGRKSVITATSAGHHGVATAAVCAKLSLECTIFVGTRDMQRKPSNLQLMKLLGAKVKLVDGNFQAAASESIRAWLENLETDYYLAGTAVGPHPIPTMVREFNSVIGKETRKQAMEKWGGKPDVLVACVGSGCNALGEIGVYHGAMCYLLQDEDGQIIRTQSVASGVDCYTVTDQEAVDAYKRLGRLEGIIPALETSHALAYLEKLCPTLPRGAKVVVNCSGSRYNDAPVVLNKS
ncbi:hypothetical protein L6452_35333 [Arctium lappa]|uniref:Uncharacterized protein n=1 Tax=Arctium lappa TaxID=4217 RepID=A0ACB8Y6T9_ARCLA|nr:hypothetical protein L6452_35333 [Arctium lappa]